jgi:hypothetical protein
MAVDISNTSQNIGAFDSRDKTTVSHWSYEEAALVDISGTAEPSYTEYSPGYWDSLSCDRQTTQILSLPET